MVVLRRVEKQNIKEAKQVGTLYHVCTLDALVEFIIPNNELKASGKYWNELLKTNQQVCFTRDPLFVVPTDTVSYGNILFQFVVDGDKLSERYKVTPFNYTGSADNQRYREKEEDVIGPIKNFKSYVKEVRFDIKDLDVNKDNIPDIINKLEGVKKYLGSIKCRRSELPFLTKHWNVRFGKTKNPNYKINTLDEFIEVLKGFIDKGDKYSKNVHIDNVDTPDLFIKYIDSLSYKQINDILEEHPTWIKHVNLRRFVNTNSTIIHASTHASSNTNKYDVLKLLIERGADVNAKNESGDSILTWACRSSMLDLVKILVGHGANVNIRNRDGITPLGEVCDMSRLRLGHDEDKYLEIAKYLINHGADVNVKGKNGDTPLLILCHNYWTVNLELVKLLINNGANVNAENQYGDTPLKELAKRGNKNIDLIKYLIANGADINASNSSALTEACIDGNLDLVKLLLDSGSKINSEALFYACSKCNVDLVKLLIDNGANVNVKDKSGVTPLFVVISSYVNANKVELIKLLLENGADVNATDDKGRTLLHLACDKDNLDLVKLFIKYGVDVNAKDESGVTPLFSQCQDVGDLEMIKLLVENGADVNVKDVSGYTPLYKTFASGYSTSQNSRAYKIAVYLLENGASVKDIQNSRKGGDLVENVYFVALQKEYTDLIKLMINGGMDLNSVDFMGDTPLMKTIIFSNDIDILKLLLRKKAKVNVENNKGETPFTIACRRHNFNAMKLLAKKGADIHVKVEYDGFMLTPLQQACKYGDDELVKVLLEIGAGKDNTELQNALLTACQEGDLEIIKLLVKNGADVNDKDVFSYICYNTRNLEVVKYLVENGADVKNIKITNCRNGKIKDYIRNVKNKDKNK